MKDMTKVKVPTFTLSGGKLSDFGGYNNVVQYRIWVHPYNGSDDFYYSYRTYKKAVVGREKAVREGKAEPILAVVFDPKFNKYREVVINKQAKKQ